MDTWTTAMPPYSRQHEQMSDQSTQFVSFYSYKGGVGRSTVLANLACRQAMQGRKVLIIDLDLERPGQHSSGLFKGNPTNDSAIKGGFIDLCEAWHAQTPDKVYEWDLRDYMCAKHTSGYLAWGQQGRDIFDACGQTTG